MVQQMLVQDLSITTDSQIGKMDITVSSLVAEDDDPKSCPVGFSLVKNHKFCEGKSSVNIN